MKKLLRNITFMLFAGALVFSCTKRINIPLRSGNIKLVVEGYLFGNDSVSWVRLTKTSGYFSNEPPPPVSHAQVVVSHKTRQWQLTESSSLPGVYFLSDTSFHLMVSDTFKLKVVLSNPIGSHDIYESQTVVPPLRIHIDSLKIEYTPDFNSWMVRYFGQDKPGKDYYLFNSRVNGKIVTDSILQKAVRRDEFFDGRYVYGAIVQMLNGQTLKVGDHYTLLASNITKEYYDYLTSLQDEVGDKNPLFSGPPANAKGNISHGALGFFTSFLTTSFTVRLKEKQTVRKVRNVR